MDHGSTMQHYILDNASSAERRQGSWGWIVAVVVALVLIGALIWWLVRSREHTPEAEVPAAESTTHSAVDLTTGKSESSATPRPSPPETTQPNPGMESLLRQAAAAQQQGDLLKARELGLNVYRQTEAQPSLQRRAEEILNTVNIELVLSPRDMPEKQDYTVRSGDSLAKLAKQFGTTVELLQKSNNIRGSMIRIGDRLRIFTGAFSILVDKSDNELLLMMNGDFFKRYRVGTGEFNKTPVGEFTITDRIAQPTWWRPDGREIPYGDPENLLGTHWLALNVRGYGIHGTWEPDTIGHQLSAGCVRMLNENVEELFTLVTLGTPVEIRD